MPFACGSMRAACETANDIGKPHEQGGEKLETSNFRSDLGGQDARLVRVGLTDLLGEFGLHGHG